MTQDQSLEAKVAALYAALHRRRPVVLRARDPAEHARLSLAAARPPVDGAVIGLALVGSVFAAMCLSVIFLSSSSNSPWAPLVAGLGMALLLAWFMGASPHNKRFFWLSLVLPAALLLGGALVGLILGGARGFGLGSLLASLLWLWLGLARVILGPIWNRWWLRYRRGVAGLPLLGSMPLHRNVEERLRHAAEGLQLPSGAASAPSEPTPAEREAGRRVQLLLERQPTYLILAYTLHPSLGVGLETLRPPLRQLRRTASAPGMPVLAERALALDQAVVVATLLEGCAVILPREASAPQVGHIEATPAPILTGLGAPVWLVWLVEHLPRRLELQLVARILDHEPDPALRQEGAEQLGPERLFAALGRQPITEDAAGALFALGPEPQLTLFVRVEDKVLAPDGSPKRHWLPVPPHMVSPREAVAWTFGRPVTAYLPELEA